MIILFGLLLVQNATPAQAGDATPTGSEPYGGQTLCLPNSYLQDPEDCLPLGPSQILSEMAHQGIPYPPRPLPANTPDDSLNEVSMQYAKINAEEGEQIAIYSSIEDASTGSNALRYLPAGILRFVSYSKKMDFNGKHFIQLKSGEWMRASPASISNFQGLIFHNNPETSFGWIVESTQSRSGPGYQYPLLDKNLWREDVVQIYQVQNVNGTDWYRIGINEWIDRRYIRAVQVNPVPPEGVENNRWIEINLYEQILSVYENGHLIFSTLIATGVEPFFTKPGLFKVYEKKPIETMTGAFEPDKSDYYYLEDVPWTLYYDEARAIHGAYWRTMFGYPQSHGCVNMSIGDARWVYDWAKVGDWVYVWDPSGETPTDPDFYGEGGA